MDFFKRKLALLPAYCLSTVMGYFFGYFLFYASELGEMNFWAHLAILSFMPLVHFFSVFSVLLLFDHPEFFASGLAAVGALLFAFLFFKKSAPVWLILFALSVFLLSLRGFGIFADMMSV